MTTLTCENCANAATSRFCVSVMRSGDHEIIVKIPCCDSCQVTPDDTGSALYTFTPREDTA